MARKAPEWTNMTNLASATFGGTVDFATDEWFGEAARLLLPGEPIFNDEFTEFGKWMDGWESRRKRVAGHDWCIIKLGLPGRIRGVKVDTAFFTGNQAPRFSLQGAWLPQEPEALTQLGRAWTKDRLGSAAGADEMARAASLGSEQWEEVVGTTPLRPGYEDGRCHYFDIISDRKYTHLRLNMFPDGGIARLKVHGIVERSWDGVPHDAEIDLLSVENGGVEVACSNHHYGEPKNMIKPGRGINMGDGWETARKTDRPTVLEIGPDGLVKAPGSDWAILRLGVIGEVKRLVVDTNHFKGNFPESILVEACLSPDALDSDFADGGERMRWRPLLPRHKAGSSREHVFDLGKGEIENLGPISHVKLSMMPDGGVMRLRAFGTRAPSSRL
ncbi:conserved unknown protein [Ectocarpus siliculosus]|uniref:Allantoicase domain-containing protein n=1 Tax=Ectocarpus siliculosus TaxID=2880 RepID=D7FJU1_ECTSI|nr:conserved unknown protein [Ectocarpus siliculosus]|eukprot:CBJ29193.1 conserved unknown protein [Ectocarpus siliculosus]